MTPIELPLVVEPAVETVERPERDVTWLRDARFARLLSWVSLGWMTVEGVVGLLAGLDAGALSVVVWASSSFVEGLASAIVIWRFTGPRTLSVTSERTGQRLVAGSFLVLIPFFIYEAGHRLIVGADPRTSVLGIAVTASAIVLMPGLGLVKVRLGRRLGSGTTAGEGVQNLICAVQAAAALIALIGASAGLGVIDPIAALLVAGLAAKESIALFRGQVDECCAPIGFSDRAPEACASPHCECC